MKCARFSVFSSLQDPGWDLHDTRRRVYDPRGYVGQRSRYVVLFLVTARGIKFFLVDRGNFGPISY
jgi:hypothetical protein